MNRTAQAASLAAALHVIAIAALHHALLRPPTVREDTPMVFIEASLHEENLAPAPARGQPERTAPMRQTTMRAPSPTLQEPVPFATPDGPTPVLVGADASTTSQTVVANATSRAYPTMANVAPAAAPPPALELPSNDADYLHNPAPPYPALSRRLGEQGKVVLRALITADGRAEEVRIQRSSGYDRLDYVALETAKRWRYVAGKRAGVAQAMWFDLPINFVLE